MSLVRPSDGAHGDTVVLSTAVKNGGTGRFLGSNAGGKFTSSVGIQSNPKVSSNLPHEGGKSGTAKPLSAGTFAHQRTDNSYVTVGNNVTTTIANVANTKLVGGQGVTNKNSLHAIRYIRGSVLQTLQWSSLNKEGQPDYTSTVNSFRTDLLNDTESLGLTRAVPGSVNFRSGSTSVTTTNYGPKNT